MVRSRATRGVSNQVAPATDFAVSWHNSAMTRAALIDILKTYDVRLRQTGAVQHDSDLILFIDDERLEHGPC